MERKPLSIVIFTSGKLTKEKQWLICNLNMNFKINLQAVFFDRYPKKKQCLWKYIKTNGIVNLLKYRVYTQFDLLYGYVKKKVINLYEKEHGYETPQITTIKDLCMAMDICYIEENLHSRNTQAKLTSLAPDLGIIYGGRILRKALIDQPREGSLNLHIREVPKYRGGGAPGFWELLDNQSEFGITVHHAVADVDAGDIIYQVKFEIDDCDTLESISHKAVILGTKIYFERIVKYSDERPNRVRQNLLEGKKYQTDVIKEYFFRRKWSRKIQDMERYKRRRKISIAQHLLLYFFQYPQLMRIRKELVQKGDAPIIILYYHRVANQIGHKMNLPLEEFIRQVLFVKKYFDLISLDEAFSRLMSGINERPAVVITFDDGFAKDLTTSIPFLKMYNIPATFFVCPGLSNNGEKHEGYDLMTPDEIEQANGSGINIGCHTMHHVNCAKIKKDDLELEIVKSREILEKIIDKPVDYFAFPYGINKRDISRESFQLAKNTYKAIVSAYGGYNIPSQFDGHHLKRFSNPSSTLELAALLDGFTGFVKDHWGKISNTILPY